MFNYVKIRLFFPIYLINSIKFKYLSDCISVFEFILNLKKNLIKINFLHNLISKINYLTVLKFYF